jgi:lipopolysaccharide/colanic/teichoic acid biosynthesis glycosyltransferase/glycosyltransferase involved in cell wall biosynthesis
MRAAPSRQDPIPPEVQVKLVHVMTVPQSLGFLRGQIGYMKDHGLEVHAVSSPGRGLEEFGRQEGIPTCGISMPRRISPWADLVALVRLVRLMRRLRPDIVQSHTPKGGFLGMMAAALAGVPIRIYTLHGLLLDTANGIRRALLWCTEKISCLLATEVIAVGKSLRERALQENLTSPFKIKVLGNGTINGVDAIGRFDPGGTAKSQGSNLRRSHGIPAEATVIGFVGRIVRDKGLEDLIAAWRPLREEFPDLHLLVAGGFEPQDPVSSEVEGILRSDPRIHLTGELEDVRPAYAAMDILVLPSYREGFPTVPLEAAAMEVPVVATRVTGCVDAVLDGVTGVLVPPRDPYRLRVALKSYLRHPILRFRHGRAGQERAVRDFHPKCVWASFLREYGRLLALKERGVQPPSGSGAPPADARSRRWPLAILLKRALDIGVAASLLILLLPVIALVALAVWWGLGTPILFCQTRPGMGGKPFRLYKFRSMENGSLPDEQRMTRLGALLRAWSLDELPQLWNVLRGDMSLVGPRPLLMQYLKLYSPAQARRHEVQPGMTGWAQVNGRNAVPWSDRFALDVWYVDHWSLDLDFKILAMTAKRVLSRSGVGSPGDATMTEFTGRPETGRFAGSASPAREAVTGRMRSPLEQA